MIQAELSVTERVRQRLRSERIDPSRAHSESLRVAQLEVRRHNDLALSQGGALIEDESRFANEVLAAVSGFGPLQPLLDDPEIEEIWINAPDRVFVARGGASELSDVKLSDQLLRELVERMLQSSGRRVDISQPFVDASLPDGSRLHVAIADVVRGSWSVNIRKFLPKYRSLAALVEQESLPAELADMLGEAIRSGKSVLVAGPTHAGKTTLLGALLAESPAWHRIVTAEETFELALDAPDVVALQGRQASLEGTGEITLRRLVKEALRMRPDRLVIGEVRDAEALDLVLALNTGVPAAATIHANSATEALEKLAMLPLLAGRNIDRSFIAPAIAASVALVIHTSRDSEGRRRVQEVVAPIGEVVDGRILTRTLYQVDRPESLRGEAS